MKKVNAVHNAFIKNQASLSKSDLSDNWKEKIKNFVPYKWEKHPFAPYMLTNNNTRIQYYRNRIAALEEKRVCKWHQYKRN